jgi:hypothetical protein
MGFFGVYRALVHYVNVQGAKSLSFGDIIF